MKNIFLVGAFFVSATAFCQSIPDSSLTFKTEKDMMKYAFSKSNLSQITSGYFEDLIADTESVNWNILNASNQNKQGELFYYICSILEKINLSDNFKADSLLFPIYNHFYSLDGIDELRIPLFITDIESTKLNSATRDALKNWALDDPFPPININNIERTPIFNSALLLDSFMYDNVSIYFNDNTITSNKTRILDRIEIKIGSQTYTLLKGESLNISAWKSGIYDLEIKSLFNDGSFEVNHQSINRLRNSASNSKSDDILSFADNPIFFTPSLEYYDNEFIPSIFVTMKFDVPIIKYSILYGCNQGIIRKPFFLLAGWGPFTDSKKSNTLQGNNWPSSLAELAIQFNQEGFIENLNAAGYDVILTQFYPPNTSVIKNAFIFKEFIKFINTQKVGNEENIICGYSAGALCAKLSLQWLENEHLNEGKPHPHTKLFVSYDGENQGANIPLGLQHLVQYLWNYEYGPAKLTGKYIYALHYILNAPLTRELLIYYHTATGSSGSPGQGPDPMRAGYLAYHNVLNHSKNQHLLGYPSFSRNISISNGSSVSNISSEYSPPVISNHYPYPSISGAVFLYQKNNRREWSASFLQPGTQYPFYYKKKHKKNWNVVYGAMTYRPLILDNATGGIIALGGGNPLVAAVKIFKNAVWGSVDIANNYPFSFTPTILTHDVRNFGTGDGFLRYNFKEKGLNFKSEYDYNSNPQIFSNTVGYPHLAYPTNHYQITPFDALWTWDNNTVHLTSGLCSSESDLDADGLRYEKWSSAKGDIKNFIVEEGEHWNIMLQNKQIGYFSNGSTYKVDYEADNDIWMGNHITQKTDFKDASIEANAVVKAMAGNSIHFTAGTHIKSGSTLHAFIGTIDYCNVSGLAKQNNKVKSERDPYLDDFTNVVSSVQHNPLIVSPNPASDEFSFVINDETKPIENFENSFFIYNFNGCKVLEGKSFENKKIEHTLKKGMYILKVEKNNTWHTSKLIIE